MSARVYAAPTAIIKPEWEDYENLAGHYDPQLADDMNEAYLAALADWCRANSKTPKDADVGQIVREPVADGYAQYMVLSFRPLELLHIDLYDGYDFRWAQNWTVKDIRAMIVSARKMRELFGRKASG